MYWSWSLSSTQYFAFLLLTFVTRSSGKDIFQRNSLVVPRHNQERPYICVAGELKEFCIWTAWFLFSYRHTLGDRTELHGLLLYERPSCTSGFANCFWIADHLLRGFPSSDGLPKYYAHSFKISNVMTVKFSNPKWK